MGKESIMAVRMEGRPAWPVPDLSAIPEEITDQDRERFARVVSTELSPEEVERVVTPGQTHPKTRRILATHWHPEFVPMDLVRRRIAAMFPNLEDQLTIPTQHNVLLDYDDYAGVEVDCYASGFQQKVQLLLHFRKERVQEAATLRHILEHTRKYRSSQLFEFMDTITRPLEDRIRQAASETGADEIMVEYVRINVEKISRLLDENWAEVPRDSVKNKLLRNWFDTLRGEHGSPFIDRVQTYLRAVKVIVKANFSLDYFYRASEVIEEARSLGGGVVIPHPEQFWPVLLAEYDVDGWEVWNPQSRRYTEFLIGVLNEKNRCRAHSARPLLVFMGDDTHFGEKIKPPELQKPSKAQREVGVQSWDDMLVRKQLIMAAMDRERVMAEYRARLDG